MFYATGKRQNGGERERSYATTGTSDPTPVVESTAEIRDQVGWVFRVTGLDQMVIVGVRHGVGWVDWRGSFQGWNEETKRCYSRVK